LQPLKACNEIPLLPYEPSGYCYLHVKLFETFLVKPMVSAPSTNYGFGLKLAVENISRAMEFSTCEAADSTLRPKLVVNYSFR
jgi:hypothetical protein